MSTVFIGLALLLVGLVVFLTTPAEKLASFLRNGLPITIIVAGIGLIFLRQAGPGSLLLFAGITLWRRSRGVGRFGPRKPTQTGASSVRSAALEMELNHATGDMNGMVLAGSFEGQELDALEEADLFILRDEIADDNESLALLDAYLDRRLSGWRENAETDAGSGQGATPGSGAMSVQEAYEVLGLSAGAAPDDIRKAHRRLMKGAHPDSGGSTFLAAKINEAKDVLLRSHS